MRKAPTIEILKTPCLINSFPGVFSRGPILNTRESNMPDTALWTVAQFSNRTSQEIRQRPLPVVSSHLLISNLYCLTLIALKTIGGKISNTEYRFRICVENAPDLIQPGFQCRGAQAQKLH